ncbi:MAG: tetratricopeptide repeat protein [Candidatus Promineifilaceae bacterium]
MANNQARFQQAVRRGFELNRAEKWQDAVPAFRAAINEFPQQPLPYAGLGEACFGLKQIDRALDCFKLAARYSGGNIAYLRKVADLQERLGRLTEAGQTYSAAGEIHFRRRELDDALANWERAIRLDPNLLAAHQRLAVVFQRLNDNKRAVREYLAIARILQMNGENKKALQMCMAARRLDPDNKDVIVAIKLIQHGDEIIRREEAQMAQEQVVEEPTPESAVSLSDAVRQMASILEAERPEEARPKPTAQSDDPVEQARRQAQNELAEEIFRDENEEEMAYSSKDGGLSKLERDALIGQGIDFQYRGQTNNALECYERAIKGGLRLPAAFFTLGMLYLDKNRRSEARRALHIAAQNPTYRPASQIALDRAR